MLKLKKNIIECVDYYNNTNLSLTQTAKMFGIDKATLKKYKDLDINELIFYQDNYYSFTEKEMNAVDEYISTDVSALYIRKKYGIKHETLNKKLTILGFSTDRKYLVNFNRDVFSTIETEHDAYFLGLLLADGYVNTNKCTVRLKLHSKDVDILEKYCDYLKMDRSCIKNEIHSVTGNLQSYVSIYSKQVVLRLHSYGVVQAKSCKETPYVDIRENLLRHYIRGYFDGDGCIRSDLTSINVCGSKEILSFICKVFNEKLGIYKDETDFAHYCNMYKVTFCGNNKRAILRYLYEDSSVYLNRKFKLFTNIKNLQIAMYKSGNIGKSYIRH